MSSPLISRLSWLAPVLAVVALFFVCLSAGLAPCAARPESRSGRSAGPCPANRDPVAVAEAFVGVPYRQDGVLDSQGRYVTFQRPDKVFTTPGLNCSGLVLALTRCLYGRDTSLKAAMRDRHGDSGPMAAGGQDWDFGWDFILNISEGLERRVLDPEPKAQGAPQADGIGLRGFAVHDDQAWRQILPRIRPGFVYLASLSGYRSGRLLHHHVGVILADGQGRVLLFHATPKGGGVHRLDLNSAAGLAAFQGLYPDTPERDEKLLAERILILETRRP